MTASPKAEPIRLLVSDIDGTLVRKDKSLSPATIAAFGRLHDAGCKTTLISARGPSGIVGLGKTLGITLPLGAFNGGTLFEGDGGTIGIPERLDTDLTQIILKMTPPGIDAWLFDAQQWYAPNTDNPRVPREKLSSCLTPTVVDVGALTGPADKIVFVSEDFAALKRLETAVRAAVGSRATVALSQPYFLDITAPAANKGDGVAALARLAGVPLSQVAVVGDMANDLPMFARAGLSIAMGQAPEIVRNAADFVTGSNEDDGLAEAIDLYVFPRVEITA